MEYIYYLPKTLKEANKQKGELQAKRYTTPINSLVIIGANGSGKSKLGAWMEENSPDKVIRIGAQRSLVLSENIPSKNYFQAMGKVMRGKDGIEYPLESMSHDAKWKDGDTMSVVDDFDSVLSALLTLQKMQQNEYLKECEEKDRLKLYHNPAPRTVQTDLQEIWKNIFPNRSITIKDAQVLITFTDAQGKEVTYNGKEMSDGERVALYLIAQALSVPGM